MLHLFKLNFIIYVAALIASTAALERVHIPIFRAATIAASVAGVLQVGTVIIIYMAWKWIPGFSHWIFPNLSGEWKGAIRYKRNGQSVELEARLNVEQNLSTITIVLETEDAESETVVVYPRRLTNRRLELLYVYETRRKEGRPPPSYRYRGTAVMRVEKFPAQLIGSYYTEQGGAGTVVFVRK